jgi:endonuclease I
MHFLAALLALVPLLAFGQPPIGYYNAAEGLSGEPLRSALSDIISPHTILDNNVLWQAYEITDARPNGTVWDMYSDNPGGTSAYVYQFVLDQCTAALPMEGDCFNREHTFPQSWYNDAAPMSTDLFNVYPTDSWVNQQRGNLPYGTVGSTNWTSTNGSKRGSCDWPGCSGTVFEPIDAYKGDLARSYFYMLTRYLPLLDNWTSPMMSGGEFLPWAEEMLLAWSTLDPVSAKEIERNNSVFALQGNRNPYIDRPEWIPAVWGPYASVVDRFASTDKVWLFDGVIHAEWNTPGSPAIMQVLDAGGRLVHVALPVGPKAQVQVDLSPGLYIVHMIYPDHTSVHRVVR